MPKFILPEKEYFSKEEIANRWECEPSLVDYYLREGLLNEAIHTHPAASFSLQSSLYIKCKSEDESFLQYRNHSMYLDPFPDVAEVFDLFSGNLTTCPEFAYLSDPNMFHRETEPGPFTNGQLQDGYIPEEVTWIAFLCGFGDVRYVPIAVSPLSIPLPNPREGERESHEYIFKRLYLDDHMEKHRVIPKEERDRFESLHSGQKKAVTARTHTDGADTNNASEREAKNRLRLIGFMLELLTDKDKKRVFSSQEQLADFLAENTGRADGMSKSNLKQVFAQANRVIRGQK